MENLPARIDSASVEPASSDTAPLGFRDDACLLTVYLRRFGSEQTKRAYRNDLEKFFQSETVDLPLARSVSFLEVNQHLDAMKSEGLKRSTMRRRLAAIRGFYDWLLALEAVERNPANRQLVRRIKKTNQADRPITFLSQAEAAALLRATDENGETAWRDKALISTLLHCVLRRSEAAAMNVEHVRPLGAHWVLDLPEAKGGTDQFVKVPDVVVEHIEAMKDAYDIQSGPLWRSFSNRNRGERISGRTIYNIVTDTARKAGISRIGAHDLRHTGCTLAIQNGATVQQVQTHARHKSLDTTMTYVHQQNKLADSAADQINIEE